MVGGYSKINLGFFEYSAMTYLAILDGESNDPHDWVTHTHSQSET